MLDPNSNTATRKNEFGAHRSATSARWAPSPYTLVGPVTIWATSHRDPECLWEGECWGKGSSARSTKGVSVEGRENRLPTSPHPGAGQRDSHGIWPPLGGR